MCKQTNKLLFAAGIGFGLLIYFWATNFADLHVINGNEKGTSLDGIIDIPKSYASKLKRHEVFLDASTGDYYSFVQSLSKTKNPNVLLSDNQNRNVEYAQWIPCGNVGMHHSQFASFAANGNFITKTRTYKVKNVIKNSQLYISKLFESQWTVLKQYIQHWSVRNCKRDFIVLSKNVWDPHPFNITNIEYIVKQYTVIAESESGCQIIEHRNTIGTQFHIDHHYDQTIQVLHNFIHAKIDSIYSNEQIAMRIEQAIAHERNIHASKSISVSEDKGMGSGNYASVPAFTRTLMNSGFAIRNNNQMLIKRNNATSTHWFRPNTVDFLKNSRSIQSRKISQLSIDPYIFERSEDFKEIKGSIGSLRKSESKNSLFYHRPDVVIHSNLAKFKISQPKKMRKSNSTEKVKSQTTQRRRNSQEWTMKEFKLRLNSDLTKNVWKDKRDIRKTLHPTLTESYLPSRDKYVPGWLNLRESSSK
jgi:hypothetical protein